MSFGGGGAGRGGFSGSVLAGGSRVGGIGGGDGGNGGGVKLGLNPYRNRGFGMGQGRVETPSLNDMRAKQGAIVAKFMTFFKRKSTLVIEMYETAFYKQKPNWDRIAEFVYSDLCQTAELRKAIQDVQFHPVKMLIFIKCSEERFRDELVLKIQSEEGVTWTDYRVRVKGYSLDAGVKFIRLLGVSPETEEEEIRTTFREENIGEVMDLKKGMLDATRLPGVTNGTWTMRVRIADPDKIIPSYIHRRDEGELWSLNFEGRVFCCWKCGSGSHIGDKCREQSRTFDEVFGGVDSAGGEFEKPTWAAVVRSGKGDSDAHNARVKEMERKVRDENLRKDNELRELDAAKTREEAEIELKRKTESLVRQKALEETAAKAKLLMEQENLQGDISCSDSELLQILEDKTPEHVLRVKDRALITAIKHKSWLEARTLGGLVGPGLNITFDPRLELIIGREPTRLAIEYKGSGGLGEGGAEGITVSSEDDDISDQFVDQTISSTPKRQRIRKRSQGGKGLSLDDKESDVEMDEMALGSSFITDDDTSFSSESDMKKLKMDDFEFGEATSTGNVNSDSETQSGDEDILGYLADMKDDDSNQVLEVSSEIPDNAPLFGPPVEGDPGGE